MSNWTLLSTHGLVLLLVAEKSEVTTRELANDLSMSERSVQRVVSELDSAGYIERQRVGRRNRYDVNAEKPLRHPVKQDKRVADLLIGLTK